MEELIIEWSDQAELVNQKLIVIEKAMHDVNVSAHIIIKLLKIAIVINVVLLIYLILRSIVCIYLYIRSACKYK